MKDVRNLKVTDFMTTRPIVVTPNKTIEYCAKLMLKKGVGSLIIKENNVPKGIVTEKDFVERVIANNIDPKKTKVGDIMSNFAISISSDKNIIEAMKVMSSNNVRRLPVVDKKGKLCGMITSKDIVKIQPELINLTLDSFDIREENRKPSRFFEGECDSCGNFGLLERIGNKILCSHCKQRNYF